MPQPDTIVIHHNPACSTSRRVLDEIRATGAQPTVNEYLKTGWTRVELQRLLSRMGGAPRDLLRSKEAAAVELANASDDALLDAMVANPRLVERPIVETSKGVRLCRPTERVAEVL